MNNKNIKVTNVYKTYFPDPPGGLQEAIRQICISTRQYGIENEVFTLSQTPKPKLINFDDMNIFREKSMFSIASCDFGGLQSFNTYNHLTSSSQITHLFHPWPFAEVLSKFSKHSPTVVTYISDIVRQKFTASLYQPLLNSTLDAASVIVANCPAYIKNSPILRNDKFQKKLRIVPLGISEESYPSVNDFEVLKKIKVDYTQPYFLFLGVLRYYKGIHTLIDAAANCHYPILIAGSGPEELKLKRRAQERGLNNVIFLGRVSIEEKIMLLKYCQALILPSHLRSEAYGMVLVEAAMYGKPMISCEIGTGTSFVNQHEETGLVIQPENVGELTEAMNSLLDEELNVKLGLQARKRYETLFSGVALGKSYAEIYKSIL